MKAKEREKEFAANKKEYEGLLGEYDALIAKWEKNKAVMSDEKKRDAQKKIIDKENDIKYLTQKLQQAQQDMSRKILAELAQDVNKVVQTIVKEKGIGMLLRADGGIVLYVDPDMDITKAVTERLNQVKPK
ncbi:OmpH family outer membrane protein [bacterium]|nr:OmpH family outer membrane protein [bacterium]